MDNIDFSSNKAVLNTILIIALLMGVAVLSVAPLDRETKFLYWLILVLIVIVYIVSIIYGNSYCKINIPLCKTPVVQDFEMKKLDDYAGKSAETASLTVVCNTLKPKQLQLKKTSLLFYSFWIVLVYVIYIAVDKNNSEELLFWFYITAALTWVTYLTSFRATSIALMQLLYGFLVYRVVPDANRDIWTWILGACLVCCWISVYIYRTDLSAGYISKYFTELCIFIIGGIMLIIILYLLYMAKNDGGSTILYTVIAGYILVWLYIIKLYFQCVIRSYYCEPNIKLSPVKNETNTDINIACEAKYI